jgi:hypothetical protein
MRAREEIEADIAKNSMPGSGAMETGAREQLTLEVLLDIREQLQLNRDSAAAAHAQLLMVLRMSRG